VTPTKPAVARIRVVNASPLITLAKIGRIDLLNRAETTLIVPEPVAAEVLAGPRGDPARRALEAGFGQPFVPASSDPDVDAWSLGRGESAVISIARSSAALAVLDDREARKAARTLAVRLTGTLGLVIEAAREGRVESAAALIQELRAAGLRLAERAVAEALSKAFGDTAEL
jgi:predicted nucleic acid-binding protein